VNQSRQHFAAAMLLIATVAWGLSFTWVKSAQETINQQAALGPGAGIGPLLLLAVRFILAGALVFFAVPRARRGWSLTSAWRASFLGFFLWAGMVLQHLGLDRTSEAVSAFLTSLTILFVPLMMTAALRRPPRPIFWVAVALATLGIWLMTGATPTGFGVGEMLGLACAIVFSVHIIAISEFMPRDDPWRMLAGQCIVVGILSLALCPFLDRGVEMLRPESLLALAKKPHLMIELALLLIFASWLAYSLQNFFQPRLDPTRAALIYLIEPIIAAAYAYAAKGRSLGVLEITGAGLILTANLAVELLNERSRRFAAGLPVSPQKSANFAASQEAVNRV
jgi:drug/metabolite transporter (DMT)-like permease